MTAIPEFGTKRGNEERRDGGCGVVFDPQTQKFAVSTRMHDGFPRLGLFSGGVGPEEDIKDGVLREVTEESGLYDFKYVEKIAEAMCHYHNNLKNVNRVAHATCFLIIVKSVDVIEVKREEHEKFTLHWATAEEILENWKFRNEKYQNNDVDHWIYFLKKGIGRLQELGYVL